MLPLNKACPKCKQTELMIGLNRIVCRAEPCSFEVLFGCPFCEHDLGDSEGVSEGKDIYISCSNCKNRFSLRKIQYLLNNGLVVDHENECSICNGPTIHRRDMTLSHRCFHFPKCSGQQGLFGHSIETLTFLDFETTGLEIGRDNIIEIGALKIDEEGYDHTFQTFITPNCEITPRITQITGIDAPMVEGAPSLKEGMVDLMVFIGSSKIVAHNVDFDLPWLVSSCLRYDIPLGSNQVICTLKWAQSNQESRCSLTALSKKYDIFHQNAHRALADAVATKELFFIFENQKISERPVFTFETFMSFSKELVGRYKLFVQV